MTSVTSQASLHLRHAREGGPGCAALVQQQRAGRPRLLPRQRRAGRARAGQRAGRGRGDLHVPRGLLPRAHADLAGLATRYR